MGLFDLLPLSCILNGKFFCVHGGLSPELKTVEDIKKIDIPETAKVVIWGRAGEHQKIKNHFTAKRVVIIDINTATINYN